MRKHNIGDMVNDEMLALLATKFNVMRLWRGRLGITQQDVARKLGVPTGLVSWIERWGTTRCLPEYEARYAAFMEALMENGVAPDDLGLQFASFPSRFAKG